MIALREPFQVLAAPVNNVQLASFKISQARQSVVRVHLANFPVQGQPCAQTVTWASTPALVLVSALLANLASFPLPHLLGPAPSALQERILSVQPAAQQYAQPVTLASTQAPVQVPALLANLAGFSRQAGHLHVSSAWKAPTLLSRRVAQSPAPPAKLAGF